MVSPEKEDEDITANILNAEFGNVDSKDLNSEDIIETYENKIKDIGSIDFNHDIEYIIKKMLVKKILRPYDVEDFIELRDREELHTSFWHSVFGNNISMEEDKMELIKYKTNLIEQSSFLSQEQLEDLKGNKRILAMLHQSLYPWLYGNKFKNFGEIMKSSEGKGIVICTGDKHFKYARSTIDTFRHVLNCTLPIEVFYSGDSDLSKSNRELLSEYDQVYVTDISTFFNNSILDIQGWSIKPFAVLASHFEEVILLDADITFIRDPSILFDNKGYQETGTLFFKDRTLHPGRHSGSVWLKSWMINPLPETKKSRFWNDKSRHEMESGTVVIHKTKTILGLLNACKLNEKEIREKVVYQKVYGDKETFWMGYDMARQSYHMNKTPCTLIGQVLPGKTICGHIGQRLEEGNIIFWNGHIIKDKNDKKKKNILVNFNAYFADENPSIWDENLECVVLRFGAQATKFDEEETKTFNAIIEREKEKHIIIP